MFAGKSGRNISFPILFLTARDGELDRVLGLEIGGDDYVTKPFSPREVAARVRAILRRTSASQIHTVGTNGLTIDDSTKRVVCDGKRLDLTAHEYKLAAVLVKNPGQVFSRDQLLDHAWDDPGAVTDRTVDAHVKSSASQAPRCETRSRGNDHHPARSWLRILTGEAIEPCA